MFRLNRKAQSTAEYAIVIALVIGAVMAMQVYVRRGLQGRMKGSVDNYLIGKTSTTIPQTTTTGLYEPTMTEREMTQYGERPTYENTTTEAGKEGQITRGTQDGQEEHSYLGVGAYEKQKAP